MRNGTVIFHVSEDYLMHHGIQGQKWGKRNGPPYPLGSQGESKSHRSAQEKKLTKNRSISSEKLNILRRTKNVRFNPNAWRRRKDIFC